MTACVLLHLRPGPRCLLFRISQPVVQDVPMPIRHRNIVGRPCEARPDVFNELQALGGRQSKDFVSKGSFSHIDEK